jgi:hypothetical protein
MKITEVKIVPVDEKRLRGYVSRCDMKGKA